MSRFACAGRALFLVCLVLFFCPLLGCEGASSASGEAPVQAASAHGESSGFFDGAERIRLDSYPLDGERSMPVPVFRHEMHATALAGQGKDCASCHLPQAVFKGETPGYSFHFLGAERLLYSEDTGLPAKTAGDEAVPRLGVEAERLKGHFHANCISCHEQLVQEGKKSGPQAESCRSCHNARAVGPAVFPSGYDKALHNRHITSSAISPQAVSGDIPAERRALLPAGGHEGSNCGACHKSYGDGLPSGGVWLPGEEDSCRACHLKRSEQAAFLEQGLSAEELEVSGIGVLLRRVSLEEAMHTACVNCHLSIRERAKMNVERTPVPAAGPVNCQGCHNASYAAAMQVRIAEAPVPPFVFGSGKSGREVEQLPGWAWNPAFAQDFAKGPDADEQDAGGIPRLQRGQPDAVLILAAPLPSFITDSGTGSGFMSPVSFNHAFHEGQVNNCRSCHHVKIAACTSCHLIGGTPEPGRDFSATGMRKNVPQASLFEGGPQQPSTVPLALAMHAADSERSCIGCHNRVKEQAACAGCHVSLPARISQASCASCHAMPPGLAEAAGWERPGNATALRYESSASGNGAVAASARGGSRAMLDGSAGEKRALLALDRNVWKQLAAEAALMRAQLRLYPRKEADIPEIIRADVLQFEYTPVHMPHNAIIQALLAGQAESRLAGVFHADRDVLCRTCHHHSPASRTPPRCVSCHPLAENTSFGDIPSLKAAYHQRCFGCHTAMQQEPLPTDCQGCHTPVPLKQPERAASPEAALPSLDSSGRFGVPVRPGENPQFTGGALSISCSLAACAGGGCRNAA